MTVDQCSPSRSPQISQQLKNSPAGREYRLSGPENSSAWQRLSLPQTLAGSRQPRLAPRRRRVPSSETALSNQPVGNNHGSVAPDDVFLNIPYDLYFQDLYLAYIAGAVSLGLHPRATVEIVGGERRLDRIFGLIQACPYSVHDLSRVELDTKRPQTPRFNMPLELGMAIALQKLNPERHVWFLFEARQRRVEKSMSDLNGSDVQIHGGRPKGLFSELASAFIRSQNRTDVEHMQRVFFGLKKALPGLLRKAGTKFPFKARVFDDLRVLALLLSDEYAIESKSGGPNAHVT